MLNYAMILPVFHISGVFMETLTALQTKVRTIIVFFCFFIVSAEKKLLSPRGKAPPALLFTTIPAGKNTTGRPNGCGGVFRPEDILYIVVGPKGVPGAGHYPFSCSSSFSMAAAVPSEPPKLRAPRSGMYFIMAMVISADTASFAASVPFSSFPPPKPAMVSFI